MRVKSEKLNQLNKILLSIVGAFCYAFGIRMFISGIGLYSGGVMGICQLISTLISHFIPLHGFDLAGIIYYIFNIPIFILAYKAIGKMFLLRTLICVTAISIFTSIIPAPAVPIVDDRLVTCIVGGLISGFGIGLTLRMGSSCGGTDIIGLYCIKRNMSVSVGNISLIVNAVLYTICMIAFNVETAIFSILFAVASAITVDHTYSQSINDEVTIITKAHGQEIAEAVNHRLVRGVTSWSGKGAYTDEDTQVLCIILSKYEVSALKAIIREIDPQAFVIVKEGVKIEGNYLKKLE